MEDEIICVFTDGACVNNGRANARAGVGVYFQNFPEWNVSKTLEKTLCKLKIYSSVDTNQRAELAALCVAMYKMKKYNVPSQKPIHIHCDSQYCVNAFNDWIPNKWLRNGWFTRGGKPVQNIGLLQLMWNYSRYWPNLQILWVRGHGQCTGDKITDALVLGNRKADKLSKDALK